MALIQVDYFSKALLRQVHFQAILPFDKVYFDVKPRSGGESKYTLKKMCSFALNSITSFSVAPLRLVSTMGITFFCLAFLFLGYVLYAKFWANQAIVGWASTAILLCFFSGI